MLNMILPKLKRLFGIGEWKKTLTHERELTKYELVRPDKTITAYGHTYYWDEGELVVKEKNDEEWALMTIMYEIPMAPLGRGYDEVERVKGVVEINEVVVGQDTWEITIDKAERSIERLQKERPSVYHLDEFSN